MSKLTRAAIGIAERAGSTFVFAFYSATTFTSLTDTNALKIAASAGVLSVLKYLAVQAKSFLDKNPETV